MLCYVYLSLIIVHWHPVLCILAFNFSALEIGAGPNFQSLWLLFSAHSPFLPPQLLSRFSCLSRGSYLTQILLPMGLTQWDPLGMGLIQWDSPNPARSSGCQVTFMEPSGFSKAWNHTIKPNSRFPTGIGACPGSDPFSHTEEYSLFHMKIWSWPRAGPSSAAVSAPTPPQRWFWIQTWFQELIPAKPSWHAQLSIQGGIAEQREGRGLCVCVTFQVTTQPRNPTGYHSKICDVLSTPVI